MDERFGLKDFTKKLAFEESELTKNSSYFNSETVGNGIYRVSGPFTNVDVSIGGTLLEDEASFDPTIYSSQYLAAVDSLSALHATMKT